MWVWAPTSSEGPKAEAHIWVNGITTFMYKSNHGCCTRSCQGVLGVPGACQPDWAHQRSSEGTPYSQWQAGCFIEGFLGCSLRLWCLHCAVIVVFGFWLHAPFPRSHDMMAEQGAQFLIWYPGHWPAFFSACWGGRSCQLGCCLLKPKHLFVRMQNAAYNQLISPG